MPRVLFGNFVNQLMTVVPGPAHVRALTAPSSRKIWYAQEGDLIILPNAPNQAFISYASALLGINPLHVNILTPAGELDEYLAVRIRRDSDIFSQLSEFGKNHPDHEVDIFAQDAVTISLMRDLDLRIAYYSAALSSSTQAIVSKLNTKSGFKEFSAGLGIRYVPGVTVIGAMEAVRSAKAMFSVNDGIVIKIDRGSNGYGHHVIRSQNDLIDTEEKLLRFYEQPSAYTIEPLLTFTNLPSIEYLLTDSGPIHQYTCDMRCVNNAWTGMTTPPDDLGGSLVAELEKWGQNAANFLHERGYRGPFDIDCGVTTENVLYATESNCRKTGGTYIDTLTRRLLGDRSSRITWVADSQLIKSRHDFNSAVEELNKRGLSWCSSAGTGVIFTSDTTRLDGKWRYLVVGDDARHARELETELVGMLEH